jgi:predicted acylesterase/phospholipase RssA/CRP-like cAMP-binding protein
MKINERLLREIEPYTERIFLRQGDMVLRQGNVGDAIYIVAKGMLETVYEAEDGNDISFGHIGVGEPVGEIQALSGGEHIASVFASVDSEIMKLAGDRLEDLIERIPEFISQLYEIAKKRLLRAQLARILTNIFGELDQEFSRTIEEQVEWVYLRGGETLFREGDDYDGLYIVITGRLRIAAGDSKEKRVIGEAGRGEMVGEMALFTNEPRSATVYAIRDCDLVRLSQALFQKVIINDPRTLMAITTILVKRLREKTRGSEYLGRVINIVIVASSRNAPVRDFSKCLSDALARFGPTLHLHNDILKSVLKKSGVSTVRKDELQDIRWTSWLNEQETKFTFVLYETDPSLTAWTARSLGRADLILLLAHASDDPGYHHINNSQIEELTGAMRSLVTLHDDNETMPINTHRWLTLWNVDRHHHVRRGQNGDFERVARFVSGNTIGLVLSGGGARGFAHIGVIRALREAGIPIDIIGGASMGSVIASAYALGWDNEKILEEVRENFVINKPFDDYTFPIISLFKCRTLDKIIKKAFGNVNIEDLWINYFCISSNLSSAEPEIHQSDSLWKAIRASVAYPGIAVPVVKGNHLLVDGGVLNNLPIDIMRKLSNGKIIAVDVSVEEDLTIDYPEIPSPLKIFLNRISPFADTMKIPTIFDILVRTAVLNSISERRQIIMDADLYLRPPVNDYRLLGFDSIDDLVDIGYRYAKEKIGDWVREMRDQC